MHDPVLPKNIIDKISKIDPEEVLQNELKKKFGQRFVDYRNDYNLVIKDFDHKLFFDYPLTVNLELVNRCNLECVMCHQGYRNDAKQSTLDENTLDKIFEDFKKHVCDRRGKRLIGSEDILFNGDVWTGSRAEELGLIDGVGDLRTVLHDRFGPRVKIRLVGSSRSWLRKRVSSHTDISPGQIVAENVVDTFLSVLEARALWARYGF